MAREIQIQNARSTAKIRNPIGVIALSLITFGIYGIFWWYFVNREMADYGQANNVPELGDNPILSVVAITIGSLIIIPPFVSFWRTLKRIETAQNRALGSNNFAVILLFILGLIPLVNLVVLPLMQSNLNQVWEAQGTGVAAAPALGEAPASPAPAPPASPAEPQSADDDADARPAST